jgi:hypothetical protein
MTLTRATRRAAFGTAVLALLAISACKGKLKGEIAVPGSELSELNVRVIPEAEIADYLTHKKPQALAALGELNRQAEEASGRLDRLIRQYQDEHGRATAGSATHDGVTVVADSSSEQSGWYGYTDDSGQHDEAQAKALAREALQEARDAYASGVAQFAEDKPSLDNSLGALRAQKELASDTLMAWEPEVFSDLPLMGEGPLTDKNGAFEVRIPRRGRVAVVAASVFKLNGRVWHRTWAVWSSLDGEAEKTLRLDENNMLLAEPRDSLLH